MINTDNKQNILIIDDNPKNIQLAANVLKTTDLFNIFFATSGEAGIQQLEKKEYALILLDINMPGMSGLELLKNIKQDYKEPPPVVMMITAYGDADNYSKAMELGADDFITKPVDFKALKEKIIT